MDVGADIHQWGSLGPTCATLTPILALVKFLLSLGVSFPTAIQKFEMKFFWCFSWKMACASPSQKIFPPQESCRTCCIHNMTQNLKITERLITGGKLHQKTYFLMMKMTALCPLPGLIGQIAWATLFQGVALQAATDERCFIPASCSVRRQGELSVKWGLIISLISSIYEYDRQDLGLTSIYTWGHSGETFSFDANIWIIILKLWHLVLTGRTAPTKLESVGHCSLPFCFSAPQSALWY